MTFVDNFREHIIPKLRHEIQWRGFLTGVGWRSFSDSHMEIMIIARKYGALHLPGDAYDKLSEWIDKQLLQSILAVDKQHDYTRWIIDWGNKARARRSARLSTKTG